MRIRATTRLTRSSVHHATMMMRLPVHLCKRYYHSNSPLMFTFLNLMPECIHRPDPYYNVFPYEKSVLNSYKKYEILVQMTNVFQREVNGTKLEFNSVLNRQKRQQIQANNNDVYTDSTDYNQIGHEVADFFARNFYQLCMRILFIGGTSNKDSRVIKKRKKKLSEQACKLGIDCESTNYVRKINEVGKCDLLRQIFSFISIGCELDLRKGKGKGKGNGHAESKEAEEEEAKIDLENDNNDDDDLMQSFTQSLKNSLSSTLHNSNSMDTYNTEEYQMSIASTISDGFSSRRDSMENKLR